MSNQLNLDLYALTPYAGKFPDKEQYGIPTTFHKDAIESNLGKLEASFKSVESAVDRLKACLTSILGERSKARQQIQNAIDELCEQKDKYFESHDFLNPPNEDSLKDMEIRMHLNQDHNFVYIGRVLRLDLDRVRTPREALALVRQTDSTYKRISLTPKDMSNLKNFAYQSIDPEYSKKMFDLTDILDFFNECDDKVEDLIIQQMGDAITERLHGGPDA